ncbi:MAG TPA: DUF1236 domain-containing protein [Pseudolabrys sp.]|nr:DUF1236 domain-containing protein [Pseudolabrys sp.]
MRVRFAVALLAAAAMTPAAALAQHYTTEDAAGGAAAGAAVAGPVGAAVGAAVGGTVGAAGDVAHDVLAPPPPPVVTYVEREDVPSVTVEKEVVVGRPLPPRVTIHVVPDHREYAYAIVNHERVIVNPRTRTVVKVIHAD